MENRCLFSNLVIRCLGDEVTLNSSEISETKEEICFMRRSTLLSLPVFSRVVIARVAMLRLESVIRFSRSRLHAVTADGCFIATCLNQGSYYN